MPRRHGSTRKRGRRCGAALISAVAILVIVAAFAALLLSVHGVQLSTSTAAAQRLRARAVANGATQLAFWRLHHDADLQNCLARAVRENDTSFAAMPLLHVNGTLSGATFQVDVWPGPDTVRVSSSATAGDVQFREWAQMPLQVAADPNAGDPNSPGAGGGGGAPPPLTREQVQALTAEQILAAGLTAEQIGWLTPTQLGGLGPGGLASLTAEQLAGLTAEQIALLSPEQFAAILALLTGAQIGWATPDQIAMLSAAQFAALTAVQRAALTPAQLAERAIADNVRALTYNRFYTLTSDHAKYLTAAQVASIPDSYWLGTLSAESRAAFIPAQIQALNVGRTGIALLSSAQREFLTPGQVQALTYGQFAYLPTDKVAQLTAAQVATIPDSYWLGTMSADARAALTTEQVQALNTRTTGISLLTADQREYLTATQVQALTYGQYAYVPVDKVTQLTPAQIATIPDSYWLGTLSSTARAAFTAEQVQALNTRTTGIALLTPAQREDLSASQVQALTYGQYCYVPTDKVAQLTPAQVATIPDSYWLGTLSADARAALTAEQVQALNTGTTGIALLTPAQRENITATQVQALTYGQFTYVPVDKVTQLAPAQVATIPDSYWLGTMSADARGALTAEQVQALNTATTGIALLTPAQRESITTSQAQALTYGQFTYVPVDKVPQLTAAQVATIPDSYWLGTMSADARAALSATQVQALKTATTGINLLTADQREGLLTSQVQALTYGQFTYVPVDKVAQLTTAQVAAIPDSYWLGTLSADARAALTATQVQALNTTTTGINLLTAAQRENLTTTQVQTLTYGQFTYVPVDKVPQLTANQVAAIPDSYWFNTLSNDAVHALAQAQVLAIPASYYNSVKTRLTDGQRAWRS